MALNIPQLDLSTADAREAAVYELLKDHPTPAQGLTEQRPEDGSTDPCNFVWEFASDGMGELGIPGIGGFDGPTVTLIGCEHGDEHIGFYMMKVLLPILKAGALIRGKLKIIFGNPLAFIEGVRGLVFDMNRLYTDRPMGSGAMNDDWARAQEVKPHLRISDIVYALHSTRQPSAVGPFIVAPGGIQGKEHLIKKLGIKTVITGKGLKQVNTSDNYTDKYGGTGITIEAGWQQDEKIFEVITGVIATLIDLGMFDPSVLDETPEDCEIKEWNAYEGVVSHEEVTWQLECASFDPVPVGTTLAVTKSGEEIKVTEPNTVVIFPKKPNEKVSGGTRLCLLAQKVNHSGSANIAPPEKKQTVLTA